MKSFLFYSILLLLVTALLAGNEQNSTEHSNQNNATLSNETEHHDYHEVHEGQEVHEHHDNHHGHQGHTDHHIGEVDDEGHYSGSTNSEHLTEGHTEQYEGHTNDTQRNGTYNGTRSRNATHEETEVPHQQSEVFPLSPDDFYEVVSSNKKVILNFYDPSNQLSQAFNSIYEDIAIIATKENLGYKFFKVEAHQHEEFSETFRILEFPTVVYTYYDNNEVLKIKYQGQKSKKAILSYLRKKNSYRPRELVEYSKFLDLVKRSKKFVIFIGDKEKHQETLNHLIQTSLDLGIHNIFWTKSDEFYTKYGVPKDKIEIVYHKRDGGKKLNQGTLFELSKKDFELTSSGILHLFRTYTKPAMLEFEEENIKRALGEAGRANPIAIFIYGKANNSTNDIVALADNVSRNRRRDFTFFFTARNKKKTYDLMNSFSLTDSELPSLALYPGEPTDGSSDNRRFILRATNGTLTEEAINQYFEDFKNNKLTPFIISEPLPVNPTDSQGVYTLVGNNFKSTITEVLKGKNILMLFCSPNERCEQFEERFSRIIKKCRKNENLAFGRINIKKNEFEGLGSESTPTLVFFADVADQKVQGGKVYEGALNTKELIKWMKQSFKEHGKDLAVESFEDDEDEDQREKFTPIKPAEDKPEKEEQTDGTIEEGEVPEENREIINGRKHNHEHLTEGHTDTDHNHDRSYENHNQSENVDLDAHESQPEKDAKVKDDF